MTVSGRGNVSRVCALYPSQHFIIFAPNFEFLSVGYFAAPIILDFTLGLIYLIMESKEHKCVVEALLVLVDATVQEHLVALNEASNMAFSLLWQVARVINSF